MSWDQQQRQTLMEGQRALERTNQSLARSERTALETEAVGAAVVTELGIQRETLLHASNRLADVDHGLSQTQSILNKMTLKVFTNKILLIFIIILESVILMALIYMKIRNKT
uniref:t-SNARE coiled-coil homology domain-containing protein n=1 Tax=Clastoptera arizonana TaxID=38151 RepID=A0A1B6DUN0_9HEMI